MPSRITSSRIAVRCSLSDQCIDEIGAPNGTHSAVHIDRDLLTPSKCLAATTRRNTRASRHACALVCSFARAVGDQNIDGGLVAFPRCWCSSSEMPSGWNSTPLSASVKVCSIFGSVRIQRGQWSRTRAEGDNGDELDDAIAAARDTAGPVQIECQIEHDDCSPQLIQWGRGRRSCERAPARVRLAADTDIGPPRCLRRGGRADSGAMNWWQPTEAMLPVRT